jgi:predicted aspartyl protease
MRLLRILTLSAVVVSRASTADSSDTFKELYQHSQWFALRDMTARLTASAFYKGVVALALNDQAVAEKQLRAAIRAAPGSWEAIEAHRMLARWYSLTGRYRRALREYRTVFELMPSDESVRRELYERKVWSGYPEPAVTGRRWSRVEYAKKDGDIFLPLSVNGMEAHYLIDTGSNASLISEGEAKRVGMIVDEAPGLQIHDSAGKSGGFRVAVAKDFVLGSFHLRNIAFLVVPDDRLPFANLPSGWRGILGLPVLLAWQTVRWDRSGAFEVGFRPSAYSQRTANMCFSGDGPLAVVRGEFAGKPVDMLLDTGAMKTRLLPFFATSFAAFVPDQAQTKGAVLQGVNGSTQIEALTLPEVAFRIGGFDTVLQSPELIKKSSPFGNSSYHVWLGSDLLRQAREVTIDFRAMQFQLR